MIVRLNKFDLDNYQHGRTTTLDVAALLAKGYVFHAWHDHASYSAGVEIETIDGALVREISFHDWESYLRDSPIANEREVFQELAVKDTHHWDAAAEAFLSYLAGGENER